MQEISSAHSVPEELTWQGHLAEILASPPFRSSVRSKQFLEYVVQESLSGQTENLKERVIGERLFGRPADYDTGQDSIVRVKASEVRRRLAQYYQQHPGSPHRFEIAQSGYTVQFVSRPQETSPASVQTALEPEGSVTETVIAPVGEAPASKWRYPKITLGIAAVLSLAAAITLWNGRQARNPAFDRFWKPFLAGASTRPLTVCTPTPEAYRIYGADGAKLVEAYRPLPPEARRNEATPPIDARIIPEPGMFMGIGDVHVLTSIASFVASHGGRIHSRTSNVTSFDDLSEGPSLVIGAETNQWHKDLAKEGRYQVSRLDGRNVVMDRHENKPVCVKPLSWEPPANYDCGIVTRILNSKAGHPLLLASGLDHFGTYVLGDYLTAPRLLEDALSQIGNWEARNIQFVVRVERQRDGVGASAVIGAASW